MCFLNFLLMSRDLKQHILQTASDLFYSQGIKATGVDAIVKAAGTTKMSLYKYFPSKDDLVLAHLQKSKETVQALVLQGIASEALSASDRLLAVFDVFAQFQISPAFRGCPFINAVAELADNASPVLFAATEFSDWLRELLAELAGQAGIRQADELAGHLGMLISGAMVHEQMQPSGKAMLGAKKAAAILLERYQLGSA